MDKIAVVGIGRLGLCFALNLERIGYQVFGVDNNAEYVNLIEHKLLKSNEPFVEEYLKTASNLIVTTDVTIIEKENIKFIYVILPTPSQEDGSFSHKAIEDFIEELKRKISNSLQRHLIIGSTVMPGYCDDLAERLKGSNLTITYNPEFIAQGSIITDQQKPDQILIGEGSTVATGFLENLYKRLCVSNPKVHVMSRLSAEITKLATNCFLTMKISFANSLGDLARTVGAEENKILAAIGSDSRIGNKYLNYGFGFGGPCFPRDNHALLAFSNQIDVSLPLSQATIRVNQDHLEFQLKEFLNQDKEIYCFESLAYKPNTDILEASQQLELAKRLVDNGKKVVLTKAQLVREKIEKLYPSYFEFQDEE
jgi:UDPglucose 6-dehydrogenase